MIMVKVAHLLFFDSELLTGRLKAKLGMPMHL
jgi:hypothetical protein